MNLKTIRFLYKKEILDVLRDKKTVLMMIVVPIILYPLMFVLGMQMMAGISTSMSEHTYKIAFDFEDENGYFEELFINASKDGYSFEVVTVSDYDQQVRQESIDAFIRREVLEDGRETFSVYYMSSVTNSNYATNMISEVLYDYSTYLTETKLTDAGLNAELIMNPIKVSYNDMSSNEETTGSLLGMIVPFMLVVSLLMGTMYPAIDTTAGERERGTLETVLTLPVSNKELIVSKFLTVATIGIVSAILNIISMGGVGVYMYNMALSVGEKGSIDMTRFIPAIIVCVLCVFAFAVFISAISMCVCAFAKSYKEANNYITPLTLVVMFASFVGFIPNVELTRNMALVPVVNICLLLRDLLLFKFNIGLITIVLISNVAYGIIAVLLLGKIYNSEAILFGDGSTSVQIFERRSNMKKGGVPSVGDAWLVVAVAAVLMIYVGGAIQIRFGYYGVLGTQFIILGVPLVAALYTKKSIKETFRINKCKIREIIGAAIMILGVILIGMNLSAVTSYFFQSSAQNVNQSMESLIGDSFLETVLVVALAPAICEELMFRGYLFSAMEKKMKPMSAMILVAVLFGVFHMSIVKFFTTALIGLVVCYMSYKSKSIFPGMLMHFMNNLLSCILLYYPQQVGKIFPIFTRDVIYIWEMAIILVIGIVLLVIGKCIAGKIKKNVI